MSGFDLPPETELAPAPIAQVGRQLSPAPWQFRFTGEDALEIASYNAMTGVRVAVHGRMWNEDEGIRPFAFEHVPNTDRTRRLERFGLPFGYLLNAVIFASSGSPKIGQTFVSLHVIRGSGGARVLLATLLQGYISAEQELGFPGSPIANSLEGGGVIRSLSGTNPAPGVEISETCPAGARWQLLSIYSGLSTSATAGNRRPVLVIDPGPGANLILPSFGVLGPGSGGNVIWASGLPHTAVVNATYLIGGLATETLILAGGRFYTSTENIAAGDDWSAPVYTVREWLEAQS